MTVVAIVSTTLMLNVGKTRNKVISYPDLTLFDLGDLGSRLETSKPKTDAVVKILPSSPPGMEKSFSKIDHFCTWKKIEVKQFKYPAKRFWQNEMMKCYNHRLFDEVLQQLGVTYLHT